MKNEIITLIKVVFLLDELSTVTLQKPRKNEHQNPKIQSNSTISW